MAQAHTPGPDQDPDLDSGLAKGRNCQVKGRKLKNRAKVNQQSITNLKKIKISPNN